jgi:hypothetical protein
MIGAKGSDKACGSFMDGAGVKKRRNLVRALASREWESFT